jgi:hypothetical protein
VEWKSEELPELFRSLWRAWEIPLAQRERVVLIGERLQGLGCKPGVSARTALDDWLRGRFDEDAARGDYGDYLLGAHWERVKKLSLLVARGRCEGWVCRSTGELQRHHVHYNSVGWESLFDVGVLCDPCHHRLTYGDTFYDEELKGRRRMEKATRDDALLRLQRTHPTFRVRRLTRPPEASARSLPPRRISSSSPLTTSKDDEIPF